MSLWRRGVSIRSMRWEKKVLLLLVAYVLLIYFIVVIGSFFQIVSTVDVVLSITPSFTHFLLSQTLYDRISAKPGSKLFGSIRFELSDAEAMAEKRWRERTPPPGIRDCDTYTLASITSPVIPVGRFLIHRPYGNRYTKTDASNGLLIRKSDDKVAAEARVHTLLLKDKIFVQRGGWFKPSVCSAVETLAVVIPYRNRHRNLVNFLNYIHRFLQRQQRHYVIIVAEQVNGNVRFNRAKLFNAVMRELIRDYPNIECVMFHDVDKLPIHLLNLYRCEEQPKQYLRTVWYEQEKHLNTQYDEYFGGVTGLTKWQLLRMNGASNNFYGWGGEDDDLYFRTLLSGYKFRHPTDNIGKMYALEHHDDMHKLGDRFEKLIMSHVIERMKNDGLKQVQYRLVNHREDFDLYTLYSFVV